MYKRTVYPIIIPHLVVCVFRNDPIDRDVERFLLSKEITHF